MPPFEKFPVQLDPTKDWTGTPTPDTYSAWGNGNDNQDLWGWGAPPSGGEMSVEGPDDNGKMIFTLTGDGGRDCTEVAWSVRLLRGGNHNEVAAGTYQL